MAEHNESGVPKIPYHVYPEHLIYNRNIPPFAKELYCIINALSKGQNGCYASNWYFSKLLQLDERTVAKHLATLNKWGYINVKNKRSKERRIFINLDCIKHYQTVAYEVYSLRKKETSFSDDYELGKKMFQEARDVYFSQGEETI